MEHGPNGSPSAAALTSTPRIFFDEDAQEREDEQRGKLIEEAAGPRGLLCEELDRRCPDPECNAHHASSWRQVVTGELFYSCATCGVYEAAPWPVPYEKATAPKAAEADPEAAAIAREVERLRARRGAERMLAAEERGKGQPVTLLSLAEFLAQSDEPLSWRVQGWQPAGTRVILAAQFKAGKTTARDNYVRALVDGDRWLGRYEVERVPGTVAVIDTEMAQRQLRVWWREQGIRRRSHVYVEPLRGNLGAFDILDPAVRAQWAQQFRDRDVCYLVLDCLRPCLDALGLDEQREAGRFLVALDALLAEAGIAESLVVHHMGHHNERSRGDSRFRDWPDVEWRLVRQDEDPASPRFISAYGRDVDVSEQQLGYDPATRRLEVAGGSRQDAHAEEALAGILGALRGAGEPLSTRAVEAALADTTARGAVRAGLALGVRTNRLDRTPGPRRAWLYECASAPQCAASAPAQSGSECASAPPLLESGAVGAHPELLEGG